MKTLTRCLFAAVLALIVNNTASAQFPSSPFVPVESMRGTNVIPQPGMPQSMNSRLLSNGEPAPPQPAAPIIVTPGGGSGVNTQNQQMNLTPSNLPRNGSMEIGGMREINRPILNQFAQVVGYEFGYEWIDPITGQTRSKTKVQMRNEFGGQLPTDLPIKVGSTNLTPPQSIPAPARPNRN